MKKLILLVALLLSYESSKACADYDPDYDYYNLFMQELVSDPQYYPFLMTYSPGFYSAQNVDLKNENIEQWQKYLGLSYDETKHLVFKASREDIRALLAGKTVADKDLKFVTVSFITKHKQSLLYLAYAKYLEPYMTILEGDTEQWYYYAPETVSKLDYNKVTSVLIKSWNAETDKELKIRYGYQLVRFAHYNRKYQTAVNYFNSYVEPLNYKPAIYYYALDQKGGALKGLNKVDEANYIFTQVFSHSNDLKEGAFLSMTINNSPDFQRLLSQAETDKEKNDIYLMLGYLDFNNPLSSLEKIVKTSPDAIQAKVLMARAVNSIERSSLHTSASCDNCAALKDKRYPLASEAESSSFFKQALSIAYKMANSPSTKDKNYWNITTAYLNFVNKDFNQAKLYLAKVTPQNEIYKKQKENLDLYIYVSEQPKITPDVENQLYAKYKDSFSERADGYSNFFLIDVLANRYFIQKDYAKSFLMSNSISALEWNPQMSILNDIEAFVNKKDKNEFEKHILDRAYPYYVTDEYKTSFDLNGYIQNMKGSIYVMEGNLSKAREAYAKVSSKFRLQRSAWFQSGPKTMPFEEGFDGFSGISNRIFGYNEIECFDCSDNMTMGIDYMSDFKFIKSSMNKLDVVDALIKLQKMGESNNELGAKANYLLGNFFYNITNTGYYRHIFRFDENNGNSEKYRFSDKPDIYKNIYFKGYTWNSYFKNDVVTPQTYLEKAYTNAKDSELRARIAFALSKCEQALYYDTNKVSSYYWLNSDQILIKDRKYFAELAKYKGTAFYDQVKSNCRYFDYYVSNY